MIACDSYSVLDHAENTIAFVGDGCLPPPVWPRLVVVVYRIHKTCSTSSHTKKICSPQNRWDENTQHKQVLLWKRPTRRGQI